MFSVRAMKLYTRQDSVHEERSISGSLMHACQFANTHAVHYMQQGFHLPAWGVMLWPTADATDTSPLPLMCTTPELPDYQPYVECRLLCIMKVLVRRC